jgi:hypothetical protein
MEKYKDIENFLDKNSAGYAMQAIKESLRYPGQIESADELRTLMVLMSRCFAEFGDENLQQACKAVSQESANSDALYQLGFDLVAIQHPDLASAILSYALRQSPQDIRILYELTASLEIQGLYEVALKCLQESNTEAFLARYLLAFNTLMAGDIGESKKITATLRVDSESANYKLKRLRDIFARAEAIEGVTPLNPSDYRGWHFILTGGFLLHLPDPTENSYGQYEHLEDSESLCKEGIYLLCAIFDNWKQEIPRILSFDNPESHRLGLAFSDYLGIPEKTVVIPDEAGLFVVYDHSNVICEVMDIVSKKQKGVQFYCHASQFTREYKVAPDFVNLFHSSIISPWSKHIIFPRRPDLPTSASTETDEQLAERIVSSAIQESNLEDLKELLNLALAGKALAAANMPGGTIREKQWHGRHC